MSCPHLEGAPDGTRAPRSRPPTGTRATPATPRAAVRRAKVSEVAPALASHLLPLSAARFDASGPPLARRPPHPPRPQRAPHRRAQPHLPVLPVAAPDAVSAEGLQRRAPRLPAPGPVAGAVVPQGAVSLVAARRLLRPAHTVLAPLPQHPQPEPRPRRRRRLGLDRALATRYTVRRRCLAPAGHGARCPLTSYCRGRQRPQRSRVCRGSRPATALMHPHSRPVAIARGRRCQGSRPRLTAAVRALWASYGVASWRRGPRGCAVVWRSLPAVDASCAATSARIAALLSSGSAGHANTTRDRSGATLPVSTATAAFSDAGAVPCAALLVSAFCKLLGVLDLAG